MLTVPALTLSLHTFGFWLASKSNGAGFIALEHSAAELEGKLKDCLKTLRTIGAPSAMSVKAHRCLQRHLDFLTNNGMVPRSMAWLLGM
jgi:hypothetical protein